MIRLAICGVDRPAHSALAGRLRNAVVDPPGERDAAIVYGDSPEAKSTAEMFLLTGKSVLLPAALCPSLDGLDGWIGLATRGAGRLAVMNAARFRPALRLVKEQLEAGKLGEVGLLRIHHWESADASCRRGIWAANLDLAAWLIGSPAECVYVTAPTDLFHSQLHVGYANGAMALITVDLQHSVDNPPFHYFVGHDFQSLAAIGSTGAAYLDDHCNVQLQLSRDHAYQALRTFDRLPTDAAMIQEYVDTLRSDRDLAATVGAWRQALLAGAAAETALATHRAVRLEVE